MYLLNQAGKKQRLGTAVRHPPTVKRVANTKVDVLYCAAHAEFPDSEPLGGGKAVADYLIRCWREEAQFPLHILSPHSLSLDLPKPLTQLSELQYARFCRRFEAKTTAAILAHDPHECIVLSNDISEGPDFAALGRCG